MKVVAWLVVAETRQLQASLLCDGAHNLLDTAPTPANGPD